VNGNAPADAVDPLPELVLGRPIDLQRFASSRTMCRLIHIAHRERFGICGFRLALGE